MSSPHLSQPRRIPLDRSPLCSFDQLKRHLVTHNELSDWCRISNPPLVSLKSSAQEEVCIERDHEILPHVALASQVDAPTIIHPIRSPGIYLDDSDADADADDERPPSPTTSFTDEFSENDTSVRGGCLTVKSTAAYQTTDHPEFVAPSLTRSTSIKFRSRVRITSGLHRHRRSGTGSAKGSRSKENSVHLTNDDGGRLAIPPSPSLSHCSSSTSISAPLRSRSDDEAERPGWAPLGRRVGMFTKKNRRNKPVDGQSWTESLAAFPGQVGGAETTPLLMPTYRVKPRSSQHRSKGRRLYDDDYSSPRRSLSPEEMEEAFGKWPDRLWNYQWWWWFTEAVICCRCLDETDDEYNL